MARLSHTSENIGAGLPSNRLWCEKQEMLEDSTINDLSLTAGTLEISFDYFLTVSHLK